MTEHLVYGRFPVSVQSDLANDWGLMMGILI